MIYVCVCLCLVNLGINAAFTVPCKWLFASCNNIISCLGLFNMQNGGKKHKDAATKVLFFVLSDKAQTLITLLQL